MAKLPGQFVFLFLYMKCIIICWSSMPLASNVQGAASCRRSDMDALMSLKNGFLDPYNRLSSWKGSNCCEWPGIRCDNISLSVIAVDLRWHGLSGNISASVTKLNKSLTYLDLSLNNFNHSPIPDFFGSLSKLRYLNLSNARFGGKITPQLGNLSNLEYIDLTAAIYPYVNLEIGSLEWVKGFGSLKYLAFDYVDMSAIGSNWLEDLNKVSQLKELHMSNCGLTGSISSISSVNFTSLSLIDLSHNNLPSKFPNWILNISTLKILHLGFNDLNGELPSEIGKMTSLLEFDLNFNEIEGAIPSSIGKLCNLRLLDVSHNSLAGSLPEYLEGCGLGSPLPNLRYLDLYFNGLKENLPTWLGKLGNLKSLFLARNSFQGTIPSSLGGLGGLESLDLSMNNLNGIVPTTIGQLSELHELRLFSNQLSGLITESHFRRMAKLFYLDLSSNSLTFEVGLIWVPPFQLSHLSVRSCQLDTTFPTWLKSQKQLRELDLSNNKISGYVPSWFWDDIAPNISQLNISFNHLRGNLPSCLSLCESAYIDLSSNLFDGPIPLLNDEISGLLLSHNRFTGPIPPTIGEKQTGMAFLALSNNLLTGEIPTSIGLMSNLCVLDLSNNNLSGTIPSNILDSTNLMILDISTNNLSGSIPSTIWHSETLMLMHLNNNQLSGFIRPGIRNISSLDTLDLSHNVLSGAIPSWLVQGLMNLRILNLRSNHFDGNIPPTISKLSSLQVLDLAENKLTGNIPSSIGNLMDPSYQQFYSYYDTTGHQESLTMNVKFIVLKYTRTSYIPNNIDLSSNRFSGPFPKGITNLSALQVLNLSRNEIHGHIPESISQMRALESLDFSKNKLSGPIPSSITSLTLLGAFDVSNNNLSGTIPVIGQLSTFNKSSFEGNSRLCGPQLNIACAYAYNRRPAIEANNKDEVDHDEYGYIYMSMGVGFAVGLILPIILL